MWTLEVWNHIILVGQDSMIPKYMLFPYNKRKGRDTVMQGNQQYKDSVFTLLFQDKEKLIELYQRYGDRDKYIRESFVYGSKK